MKRVNELKIGEKISGETYVLTKLKVGEKTVYGKLSDQTGSIYCDYPVEMDNDYMNRPVFISGVVLVGNEAEPYVKIRSMELAQKGGYSISDLYVSLPDEYVRELEKTFHGIIRYVKKEPYKQIIEALFQDIMVLDTMKRMPAHLFFYDTMCGGMLDATVHIAQLAVNVGITHNGMLNPLYGEKVDLELLAAGALLLSYGNLLYFTEKDGKWEKDETGILQGYTGCLYTVVYDTLAGKDVDRKAVARLLGMVSQSCGMKTSTKTSCQEALILRWVAGMYRELDNFASRKAEHSTDTGMPYDSLSNRYFEIE